jgi:hypothetical protein
VKYPTIIILTLLGYAPQARVQETQEYPWLDDMHSSIADSMNASAQWFDDFFVSELGDRDPKALGEARIRLGWEPRSRDLAEFDTRFRVRFKLPNLKNRVDVVVSDYDDTAPESTDRAARTREGDRQERFSLALQWQAKSDSGLSHRIGVGRRLQAFAKSRYRDTIGLTQDSEIRWESSAYYYSNDGFGANFSALLNCQIDQQSLFRFDNNFYYRDKSKDWLWQHSWQYLYQLNDKSALVYGYYIEGLNRPNYQLNEHLTSIRFRQNALREWLFYEIEPFILWRRDEDFKPSYGIALRIEGYFDKN